MKIGILTFHYAHNYGAVLQAYALKKLLEKQGHQVKIINYRNTFVEKNYKYKLRPYLYINMILNPQNWKKFLDDCSKIKYSQIAWRQKWKKFDDFIIEYLQSRDVHTYEIKDIQQCDLDALICGSDQIWSKSLTGKFDSVYFLNIQIRAKKIAYGASMGSWNLNKKEEKIFCRLLENFDYISVREQNLSDNIKNRTNRSVEVVADPTLLLEFEDYMDIIWNQESETSGFVFAYYVVDDPMLKACAEKTANELGKKLVQLHYFLSKEYKDGCHLANLGPQEFLWYIKNAEFILTNSFHGTAFSVLAQKPFYCVYNHNERIHNLLVGLELEDRHIFNARQVNINDTIDYMCVRNRLNYMRETSIEYLRSALYSAPDQ